MSVDNKDLSESGLADTEREQRSQIVKRLMFATAVVGVLLGLLAFFDYLSSPDEPETQVFTEPVPVPPKRVQAQPVTQVSPEEVAPEEVSPEPAPEPPVVEPVPTLPPAPAVVPAAPVVPEPKPSPVTPPASTAAPAARVAAPVPAPAPVKPGAKAPPVAVKTPPPAPMVEPVPEFTAPPSVAIPQEPVAPAPAESAPPVKAEVISRQPAAAAASRILPAFLVQAGVFSSVKRAESLQAKLKKNGIPSTLETRVQVGPFKSREEAEAAQAKLKALGIEGVFVASPAAH
ncbi:MAG: SPOR domain-containing protein [Azovibrio sp.]